MEPVFTAGFWLGSGSAFVTEVGDVALGRPFATTVSGMAVVFQNIISFDKHNFN